VSSAKSLGKEAKARAEAEAVDADLERCTTAVEEVLKKGFEAARALDTEFDFGDFALSELSPAWADRRVFAETAEE
jgi:hypothetical protein